MRTFKINVTAHLSKSFNVDAEDENEAKQLGIREMQDILWTEDVGFTEDYSAEAIELVPAPIAKVVPRCWCGAELDLQGLCPLRHETLTEDAI